MFLGVVEVGRVAGYDNSTLQSVFAQLKWSEKQRELGHFTTSRFIKLYRFALQSDQQHRFMDRHFVNPYGRTFSATM
jgi:hypothetical protein